MPGFSQIFGWDLARSVSVIYGHSDDNLRQEQLAMLTQRAMAAQARNACERLTEHGYLVAMGDGLLIGSKRHKEAWRVVPD